MKCVICKQGETAPGSVTVTLQQGPTTVIFKNVPADVCNNCREYYLNEDVSERLSNQAKGALKDGAEVEVLSFVA